MFDIVKFYCDFVIKPIENHTKELRAKVYSKNIFDIFSRRIYKEYLEKAENLLFESYQKLGKIIQEELEFNEKIKKAIEKDAE